MIFKTRLSYNLLCEQCFLYVKPLNRWRKDFIKDVLWLFLSIKSPVNFLQLGRYGKYGEQRYRQQFESSFASFNFNAGLINQYCGQRRAIAFAPSYIPKSGRETEGVGWFWSGCANKAKWGLETGGIAVLDFENHTALHLEAVQTLPLEGETLLEFYARIFRERAEELQKLSQIVVVDGYFSKQPFVSGLTSCGLDVISRFRSLACLSVLLFSRGIDINQVTVSIVFVLMVFPNLILIFCSFRNFRLSGCLSGTDCLHNCIPSHSPL
jgi:hypothetical protein